MEAEIDMDFRALPPLESSPLFQVFKNRFLMDPGQSLLGAGQSGSGKTEKSYTIDKWLIKYGHETPYVIDCGKPDEINPLSMLGLPLNIIVPSGCEIIIENCPCQYQIHESPTAEASFAYAKRGYTNIFSFKSFFYDVKHYQRYLSDFFGKLLFETQHGRRHIDMFMHTPAFIKMDEFHDICPSNGNMEDVTAQKRSCARIAMVLKKLRSSKIRVTAYSQAQKDIYPAARRQFQFHLLSRSPGLDLHELNDLNYNFSRLPLDIGLLVFPEHTWQDWWKFYKFPRPENMFVEYHGEYRYTKEKKKRRVEVWQRVVDEDEEEEVPA
jgi:hypothetical protein